MAQGRVPWNEVLEVIKETQEYYKLMLNYQDLVDKKHMPVEMAETLCANPIKMIHSSCYKALRTSNI